MTILLILISILAILNILFFILFISLKSQNKDLISGIKFTNEIISQFDLYNKILNEKIQESYDIILVRDISVYINNKENFDDKDFHGLSKSFCLYFRKFTGRPIYNRLIILFGSENQLIEYLVLRFNKLLMETRLKSNF